MNLRPPAHPYESLLQHVLFAGETRPDRTGTGTLSVFGAQMRYNLETAFPLITTKRVHMKSVVGELLWFLSGSTNAHELRDKYGVTIWDEWADANGELGPIYSRQWRSWPDGDGGSIDQISRVIDDIVQNPHSRRHIVSAWNVAELEDMALAPCHVLFQFYVTVDGRLSCHLYQRSADLFLGVPFNLASYGLLTCMIAQQCELRPGDLVWSGGDVHLYSNHLEQAREQLRRRPRAYPTIELGGAPSIFDYDADSVRVIGYDPHPPIAAPVAV